MKLNIFKLFLLLFILSYCSYGSERYGLRNWGLESDYFHSRSDIQIKKAWTIEKGNPNVIVAIIDTGIDFKDEHFNENLWHDPKDPSIFGWNFVSNQPNPIDFNGHGTHVAGIIASRTDMRNGVSGVAPNISIMPIKYYSDANSDLINLANTVKSITYAVDHGARIINYSSGGPKFSEDEYLAIKYAESKGVLLVVAAGNENLNTDKYENYYYPSAYSLSNIISVAATNIRNQLVPSSNWGFKKVDVVAPGENIYSTLPYGHYGYMTGTSQATPFVSGIAALLLSENSKLTPSQIKCIILESSDKLVDLKNKVKSEGKVNAYKALILLKQKLENNSLNTCSYK